MKAKLIITLALISLCMLQVRSQDFHLTQYDAFSLYLNPALTGNYLGESNADYRVQTVYRTQWRPLASKPYTTYGMSYDTKYKRFGLGGYLLDNRSGGLSFNTLNFQLSGSYFITDPKESPHLLNVGLQLGGFYKTFNFNNALFESQYDYSSGQLNSNINSGEVFQRNNRTNFDANMGMYYKYKKADSKFWPFLGLAVFHANMPVETFTSYKSRLPMRWTVNGGCDFIIDEKWKVTPMILYMNQARAWEMNVGGLAYYKLNDNKEVKYDLIFGLNYRVKDAVMLQAGVKKDNFMLRMSYDVNTSYLNSYSNGKGGFEITLSVTGKKGESPFKSMASF
jgi:type IX secretion system PorP/SprF family membrane protein